MAIVNKPDINYGTWAENGNIEIPSSEKVEEGWVIEKPLNEHMNWLQNRSDKMLQYLNQRGIPEWDFRTEYPIGTYSVRNGVLYKSRIQNTDKDPLGNTEIWYKPFADAGIADTANAEIEKIKNQSGYLQHYVIISEPVMTAAVKGVAYNNSDETSGYNFISKVPTVYNNNKIVASFSGESLPKDVVTHEQLNIRIQSYQVGDIYLTTSSQNPKIRFGYGTWERFAEGEVLVGFSTSVSNDVPQWIKTAGSKFGAYEHTLTQAEIPRHRHSSDDKFDMFGSRASISGRETQGSGDYNKASEEYATGDITESDWATAKEKYIGEGQPHNNVQPSVVVYMWKRIE